MDSLHYTRSWQCCVSRRRSQHLRAIPAVADDQIAVVAENPTNLPRPVIVIHHHPGPSQPAHRTHPTLGRQHPPVVLLRNPILPPQRLPPGVIPHLLGILLLPPPLGLTSLIPRRSKPCLPMLLRARPAPPPIPRILRKLSPRILLPAVWTCDHFQPPYTLHLCFVNSRKWTK